MRRKVILIGLLLVGLMAMGGYLGWLQGYAVGLAAEGEVIHHHTGGFAPFFIGLGLLKLLFFLLLFLFISKLFFRGWRSHGRAYPGPWGRHLEEWHEHHHQRQAEGNPPDRSEDDDKPPVA